MVVVGCCCGDVLLIQVCQSRLEGEGAKYIIERTGGIIEWYKTKQIHFEIEIRWSQII